MFIQTQSVLKKPEVSIQKNLSLNLLLKFTTNLYLINYVTN